jgi:hypothetical protein
LPTPNAAYSDPEFSWLAPVAVTAIHFVRDGALGPAAQGDCLAGAFNTRSIYRFTLDAGRTTLPMPDPSVTDRVADTSAERDLFLWATGFDGGIVDIDSGPDGALYVLALESGTLYRILNPTAAPGAGTGAVQRWIAYPNPFAGTVHLRAADLRLTPPATLAIYSVDGRLVRRLAVRGGEAAWDGCDARGVAAGAGTYFACSPGWRTVAIHRLARR